MERWTWLRIINLKALPLPTFLWQWVCSGLALQPRSMKKQCSFLYHFIFPHLPQLLLFSFFFLCFYYLDVFSLSFIFFFSNETELIKIIHMQAFYRSQFDVDERRLGCLWFYFTFCFLTFYFLFFTSPALCKFSFFRCCCCCCFSFTCCQQSQSQSCYPAASVQEIHLGRASCHKWFTHTHTHTHGHSPIYDH